MDSRLPLVAARILQMRYTSAIGSGTVRWSALLLASKETLVTDTRLEELEQGGRVRQAQLLRHDTRDFVVGVHW